jgi:uncharacterized protein (TIGR02246 family)
MRKTHLVLGAFLSTAGCAARTSPADEEAAIRQSITETENRMRAGDQAAIAAMFTENAVMLPPNEPALNGRAAIQAWGENMFSAVKMIDGKITPDGIRVAGDWASGHGTWSMTLAAGRDTIRDTTRWILEWERQPDGKWLISRDIWNSAKPLPAPK